MDVKGAVNTGWNAVWMNRRKWKKRKSFINERSEDGTGSLVCGRKLI